MSTDSTTIRLTREKLRIIEAIAQSENKTLSDIFTDLANEYIERYAETTELLNIPNFADECHEGLKEIEAGKGRLLIELEC
ncbi:hypothetical protein [Candidatus Magnetobacterium casense]|uniref:CopG family transcriptional regulator n=1 Tax=Candidatus Magnetobacterium casense TaxID=1455061 RepID=A0ABS6S2C1_9BACT|nr:hypothetical protein [Candidatus Magnetobacterium casensis]MBV6342991.1 hypothetical protein [Candidatus Magnetobacterium casensis]